MNREPHTLGLDALPVLQELVGLLLKNSVEFKTGNPFVGRSNVDPAAIAEVAKIDPVGLPLEKVLSLYCSEILSRGLNFSSPGFLAHPDCANSTAAVLGEIAAALFQQNLVTHEYSGVATRLEYELILQLRNLIGYPTVEGGTNSAADAGGVFLFGGSGGNLTGLLAARECLSAKLQKQGKVLDKRRARVLANSPYTHYSLRRSLFILGLGNRDLTPDQCREQGLDGECLLPVATKGFCLDPDDLERTIEKTLSRDEEIVCIFAVAGDSRIMEFDNLRAISKIAQRYDIWVHVDASQGGQCLFSPRRKHLFDGVELTQSISLDPHKVLMMPYNLGIFLLRDPSSMSYIASGASVIRLGTGSFGTYTPAIGSRGFNSLKLWFLLKHWGWNQLADEIDRRHELAKEAFTALAHRPNLVPIHPEVVHNAIGFIYRPPAIQNLDLGTLNKLNAAIHREVCAAGNFFIHMMSAQDAYKVVTSGTEEIIHLRMMFGNPLTDIDQITRCFDEIERVGEEILASGTVVQESLWKDHDR